MISPPEPFSVVSPPARHLLPAAGRSLVAALVLASLAACNSGSSPSPAPAPETSAPAENVAPVGVFQSSNDGLMLSVDGSGSSDSDGQIVSWHWTFGEAASPSNTATGASASHQYSAAGTYTVTLTVTDNAGATAVSTRTVSVAPANLAPLPAFTATPSGLSVSVSGYASSDPDGTIASYAWEFGEPSSGTNTATGGFASHTYVMPGTYAVTLTVTDNQGLSAQRTQNVTVAQPNVAPVAGFTSNPNDPVIDFDAASSTDSDGTIVAYAWDFGEPASGASNTATGVTASHTYASTGNYTVSLTVTDNQGATHTTTGNVTITSTAVVSTGNLQFRADWTRAGDLDLTVTTPNGNTIWYGNTGPSAGTDMGQLERDETSGTGPENIYWANGDTPPSGSYHLCMATPGLFPAISPSDPVTVTATVRRPSVAPQTFTRTFTASPSQYLCSPAADGFMGTVTLP